MLVEKAKVLNEMASRYLALLGSNLVGIYLHGSLAMNCYNPKSSDIEILVVVKNNLEYDVKRKLIECLFDIEESNLASRIEMSVVLEKTLHQVSILCSLFYITRRFIR